MELEHRFEVPVGIDKAFPAMLDIQEIGPCFPGANLDKVEDDRFEGSVRIKIGPVLLNYRGTARFVEKDSNNHRAVIEATGSAPRSGSTATMLVHASATAVAANRTAIVLVTTLSITGRAANFGRQVMIDVGNELISTFADCVSKKLTGKKGGGATLLAVTNPDEVAAEMSFPTAGRAQDGPTEPAAGGAQDAPTETSAGGPVTATQERRPVPAPTTEPVNVLTAAKAPLLKQLLPAVLGILVLIVIVRSRRRRAPVA